MLFPFSFDSPNSLNTVPHKEVSAQARTCTTPRCSSQKKKKSRSCKERLHLMQINTNYSAITGNAAAQFSVWVTPAPELISAFGIG